MSFDDKKAQRMLKALPDRIERRVLRQAIRPASALAAKAAKRLAPRRLGLLKKAIASKIKSYTATNTVAAIVGANMDVTGTDEKGRLQRPGKYIHLVEKGTRPHKITITPTKGPMAGRTITLNHPGTKPPGRGRNTQ